jgi:hypothetical protein
VLKKLKRFRKEYSVYTWDEVKNKNNSFEFSNSDKFILEDEVKSVLDSIENDINTIEDKLSKIKGLDEIDEVYKIIIELSEKLY